jgi:hypothetical protein
MLNRVVQWFTGPRPLVSEEEERWVLEGFGWLLRASGGFGRFRHALTVLPEARFFPQRGLRFPDLQQALLEQIKAHAGMSSWPCRLLIQQPEANPLMPGEKIPSAQSFSPAASFLRTPQGADITMIRPGCLIQSPSWPPWRTSWRTIWWKRSLSRHLAERRPRNSPPTWRRSSWASECSW